MPDVLERTPTRTTPRAAQTAALGVACAALATVVWSGSFVTSRALHDSVPPVQQAFWRWIVALVAVAPFGARQAWRQRALIRRRLGFVVLASLLGVTVYNTLVNQAGLTTPAATMGLIMAASPVLMAVLERASGVRLGRRRVTGLLVACSGVLLLMGGGAGFAAGDLWMIGAACCFAGYSALLRRRPAELGGAAFLFTTFLVGAGLLLPAQGVSLAVQGASPRRPRPCCRCSTWGSPPPPSPSSPGTRRSPWSARPGPESSTTSSRCVALLSWAVLGETFGPVQVLCLALILGGVMWGAAARHA